MLELGSPLDTEGLLCIFCLQVAQDIMSPVQGEIAVFHVQEGDTVEVRNIGDAIVMWV